MTAVNALGSGILETRALTAFLPDIAQALTGKPLALPSIATWWCGREADRRHVLENLDRMMIGPALSTRLPFEDDGKTVLGESLSDEARTSWWRRSRRMAASSSARKR